MLILVAAGLDVRYGWSPRFALPALVIDGNVLGSHASAVNRFFSSMVRIQHRRGPSVVSRRGPTAGCANPVMPAL
jgi:hypothetical protein